MLSVKPWSVFLGGEPWDEFGLPKVKGTFRGAYRGYIIPAGYRVIGGLGFLKIGVRFGDPSRKAIVLGVYIGARLLIELPYADYSEVRWVPSTSRFRVSPKNC